jgi:hypothetical protein
MKLNRFSSGNSFITKLTSKFSPTLFSRSIFHIGVIQKYMLLQSIPHHDITHCSLIVAENKWLMELITAAHCWQIITNSHIWTALLAVKHNAIRRSTKLVTSLNSKHYWPSGILIHWQNFVILATGGAPVTIKHRAVNQSTKVRIFL